MLPTDEPKLSTDEFIKLVDLVLPHLDEDEVAATGFVNEFLKTKGVAPPPTMTTTTTKKPPVKPKKMLPLKTKTALTAAPSWVETSITWLEQEHPELLERGRSGTARLARALRRMSWHDPRIDAPGLAKSELVREWETWVEEHVQSWGADSHDDMRAWIEKGAYLMKAEDPRLAIEDEEPAATRSKPAKPEKMVDPAHELLEAVDKLSDARFGAW